MNLFFSLSQHQNWAEFYGSSSNIDHGHFKFSSRSTFSTPYSHYFHYCDFENLLNPELNGGALCFEYNSSANILIEECTFTKCTGYVGGAIYQESYNSFVQKKVISKSCGCASRGSHSCSYINCEDSHHLNFLYSSSLTDSFVSAQRCSHIIKLYGGLVKLYSTNISSSAIDCSPISLDSSNSDYNISNVFSCYFYNITTLNKNNPSGTLELCGLVDKKDISSKLSYSYIFNCNSSFLISVSDSDLYVTECCFYDNAITKTAFTSLTSGEHKRIFIYDCYIDNISGTSLITFNVHTSFLQCPMYTYIDTIFPTAKPTKSIYPTRSASPEQTIWPTQSLMPTQSLTPSPSLSLSQTIANLPAATKTPLTSQFTFWAIIFGPIIVITIIIIIIICFISPRNQEPNLELDMLDHKEEDKYEISKKESQEINKSKEIENEPAIPQGFQEIKAEPISQQSNQDWSSSYNNNSQNSIERPLVSDK